MKKFTTGLLVVFSLASLSSCGEVKDTRQMKKLLDRVYDIGVKRVNNEDQILEFYRKMYNGETEAPGEKGGCSIVVKKLDDGRTVAARNMDYIISNKPAYVVRTEMPGQNKTVSLFYTSLDSCPDESVVIEKGVDALDDFHHGVIPYNCTDVMNEKGLYVQYDMRTYEGAKFVNTGTNPSAKKSVPLLLLPSFIGRYADDVESAVNYVKNDINVYSADAPGAYGYGFACMLVDKKGNYGLLEIAGNKISFLDKQAIQTNYYLTPEFAEKEDYKAGTGRYEVLSKGLSDVHTEDDILNLIKKVNYFQCYAKFEEERTFNSYSEWVNEDGHPNWTNKYIDEHMDELREFDRKEAQSVKELLASGASITDIRNTLKDKEVWNSTFTLVADPANQTMKVRFFEDESLTTTIKL